MIMTPGSLKIKLDDASAQLEHIIIIRLPAIFRTER
jgi:hypothetical protein